jgi:hypothetical protein
MKQIESREIIGFKSVQIVAGFEQVIDAARAQKVKVHNDNSVIYVGIEDEFDAVVLPVSGSMRSACLGAALPNPSVAPTAILAFANPAEGVTAMQMDAIKAMWCMAYTR